MLIQVLNITIALASSWLVSAAKMNDVVYPKLHLDNADIRRRQTFRSAATLLALRPKLYIESLAQGRRG